MPASTNLALLACGLIAVSLAAQSVPIPSPSFSTLSIPPGVMSSPLTVNLTDPNTAAPDAGLTVTYTTASTILFLPTNQAVSDSSGNASISVIGLEPGTAQVSASTPGGSVVFSVTVLDPGASPIPQPSGIGRIVWQGSSTLTTGTPFIATVSKAGIVDSGATVSVAVTQGSAQLLNGAGVAVSGLSLITQSDGTLAFHAQFPSESSSPEDPSIITLTVQGGSSAVFLVHALPPGSVPTVQVAGSVNQVLPLIDGNPSSIPIQLALKSASGTPLAGVSATLVSGPDVKAFCDEAILITATDGTMACHLAVSGLAGTGSIEFLVGSVAVSPSISYNVAPAAVGLIRLLSGNLQTGRSGYLLPVPLTVQLLDAYGNPVISAPVAWQTGTTTLVDANPTTDESGIASATVQIGSQPGPQSVTLGASGLSAQFDLTDTSLGQITAVSGNAQVANPGEQFGRPLIVRVANSAGLPVPGRPVKFSVVSGTATLEKPVVPTGLDGMASVRIKAGHLAGPISVEADAGTDRADFVLSALPPAAESITVSDWNGQSSPLVPGALMTVAFISAERTDYRSFSCPGPPYPTSVQGLSVSFNDTAAPILQLSSSGASTELLVQIPWELSGAETARLLLSTGRAATAISGLPVEVSRPVIRPTLISSSRVVTLPVTGFRQFAPLANTNSGGIAGQTVSTVLSLSSDGISLPILNIAADPLLVGAADVTVAIPFALKHRLTSTAGISISSR